MRKLSEEEESGYEAARAEFFLVCRGDLDAEKCWPKAAAACGAAMGPSQAKIEALKAEIEELKAWLKLVGREHEENMRMADRV